MNTQAAAPFNEKDLWTITEDPEAPGRFVGLAMSENGTPLTVHSSHRELLAEQLITWQKSLQMRDEFLAAWKAGVKIAGDDLFRVERGYARISCIDEATTKWQLVPARDEVEAYVLKGKASRWTRAFVAAMCSFYNSEWAAGMLKRLKVGSIGELAQGLDGERRTVLAALLVSYRGW
ncbi:MAG: hypothetical protein AB1450_08205 [Pseudomonadota bacterium]